MTVMTAGALTPLGLSDVVMSTLGFVSPLK